MAVFSGNGSDTAPSFTFSSDTDTGFFRYDADKLGVVTAGTLRAIFDAQGRFLVGTTSNFITAGETISTAGTIVSQVNSTTISPFYASNNTSDSAGVPFYSMHDGSANRGGLFLDSSSIVKLSGQVGIDLATSTAAPAPTKVRIDSTGDMLIGGTIPSSPSIQLGGFIQGGSNLGYVNGIQQFQYAFLGGLVTRTASITLADYAWCEIQVVSMPPSTGAFPIRESKLVAAKREANEQSVWIRQGSASTTFSSGVVTLSLPHQGGTGNTSMYFTVRGYGISAASFA
jgi:hypothetical protein